MDCVIENEFLRVTLTTFGAQIKSVIRKSDGVEHIWCGDPKVWKFQSPILFPYCGKILDGRIEIRGKTVENAPIHGVVRTMEHSLISQERARGVFAAESCKETLAIFPYRFRLVSSFSLEEMTLCHRLTVENTDETAFPFGIGYHPAFAIPFDDRHTIEDYELRFSDNESPLCLETPNGLLNGRYYALGRNIQTIPVKEGMFDGGGHCMTALRSKTLGIYEKDSSRAVVCDIESFPHCLIWGTEGRPPFVCIEPWHTLPDFEDGSCIWDQKPAAAILQPQQCWTTQMCTSFL